MAKHIKAQQSGKKQQTRKETSPKTTWDTNEMFSVMPEEKPFEKREEDQALHQELVNEVIKYPEIRTEKTAIIKRQIDNNTYTLDSIKMEKVAEALIDDTEISFGIFG